MVDLKEHERYTEAAALARSLLKSDVGWGILTRTAQHEVLEAAIAAPDLLAEVVRVRVLYTNIYDCCSKYDEVKAVHKILKLIGAELEGSNGS